MVRSQRAGSSTRAYDYLPNANDCIWPLGDFALGICAGFQLGVVAAELVLDVVFSGLYPKVGCISNEAHRTITNILLSL